MRVEYDLSLRFVDIEIKKVIIDQYYSYKHFEMNDWIILELIKTLNFRKYLAESEVGNYRYFSIEPVFHNSKPYRIVFLLEKECNYVGVINAFRVQEKKHALPIR